MCLLCYMFFVFRFSFPPPVLLLLLCVGVWWVQWRGWTLDTQCGEEQLRIRVGLGSVLVPVPARDESTHKGK